MNGFPDKASIEKLRYYGIKTVVLHTVPRACRRARPVVPSRPTRRRRPPSRSPGLGVTRRQVGSLVIYEIGPGPKALHGND